MGKVVGRPAFKDRSLTKTNRLQVMLEDDVFIKIVNKGFNNGGLKAGPYVRLLILKDLGLHKKKVVVVDE